jgi:hypothetical protein
LICYLFWVGNYWSCDIHRWGHGAQMHFDLSLDFWFLG